MKFQGKELLSGTANAYTLTLGAPLSLWDGIDGNEGKIVQLGHPEAGQSIAGVVLVLAKGLSGATAGGVLTECLKMGKGPVALVLPEADEIVIAAAVVAGELYDKHIPVLQVDSEDIIRIPNGVQAEINNGVLTVDNR